MAYEISVKSSGLVLGAYDGCDAREAALQMVKDAGYSSIEEAALAVQKDAHEMLGDLLFRPIRKAASSAWTNKPLGVF